MTTQLASRPVAAPSATRPALNRLANGGGAAPTSALARVLRRAGDKDRVEVAAFGSSI